MSILQGGERWMERKNSRKSKERKPLCWVQKSAGGPSTSVQITSRPPSFPVPTAPSYKPCFTARPGMPALLSLALVYQHFLPHAAWLPTPENPPFGSRLSCSAQAVLTSTLSGGDLQVQHVLPGSPIGFSRQILWPLGNTWVPSPWS